MVVAYSIRECRDAACRLRFPVADGGPGAAGAPSPADAPADVRCPRCGGLTTSVHTLAPDDVPVRPRARPARFSVLVDGVRSAFNVGSILRSAEGVGVDRVYLCGISPPADNPKVAKTALGAEHRVHWSHHRNAVDLAAQLKGRRCELWAIESTAMSSSIFDAPAPSRQTIVVIGNEVVGVDPDLLGLCDRVLHIEMAGAKSSYNVAVAFGVAAALLAGRGSDSDDDIGRSGPG